MKARKCPVCGIGKLKKKVSTETFEYKGIIKTIANYVTLRCEKCGESIVDKKTLKDTGRILKDFQRHVDGLLTVQEIRNIRKKLNLSQEEMAEILGGGLKSFARYETGQVSPSRGMDNLLRILDAYPFVLNVLRKSRTKNPPFYNGKKVMTYEDFMSLHRYKVKTKEFTDK